MKAFLFGVLGALLVVGFPYIVGFFMVAWDILRAKITSKPSNVRPPEGITERLPPSNKFIG